MIVATFRLVQTSAIGTAAWVENGIRKAHKKLTGRELSERGEEMIPRVVWIFFSITIVGVGAYFIYNAVSSAGKQISSCVPGSGNGGISSCYNTPSAP
jgi:hypothetical protein